MSKFKKYSEYKDSGVDWIGEIPSHWNVNRNIQIFEQRVETGRIDLPILEVSIHTGVSVRDMENGRKQVMDDYSSYKIAHKDDLAYNMMRMWQGAVGTVPEMGFVSPAYVVIKPRKQTNTKFFEYLFRTPLYKNEINRASRGIVEDRNRLYWDGFKQIASCNPPEEEKHKITQFLENETTKIDTFITNKQKLIELLKEQKTAIINKAVTKGLNSDVPMKDSGIEWLGEIPAHWEVKKLKYLSKIKTGEKDTENRVEDGKYPFYVRSQTVERIDTYSFEGEAVLTAGDGAGVGKVFHYVNEKFEYHQRVYKISDFREISGKYLFYYIRENFQKKVMQISAKTTVDSLRLPMFLNFEVAYGNPSEMNEIVEYVEKESAKIEQVIETTEKEIVLIQEYRQSLITNAVTGKIDVRELV